MLRGLRRCENARVQTHGTTTHFINIAVRAATDSLNQFVFFLRIPGADVRAHGGGSAVCGSDDERDTEGPRTLLWTDKLEGDDGGGALLFGRKSDRERGR